MERGEGMGVGWEVSRGLVTIDPCGWGWIVETRWCLRRWPCGRRLAWVPENGWGSHFKRRSRQSTSQRDSCLTPMPCLILTWAIVPRSSQCGGRVELMGAYQGNDEDRVKRIAPIVPAVCPQPRECKWSGKYFWTLSNLPCHSTHDSRFPGLHAGRRAV